MAKYFRLFRDKYSSTDCTGASIAGGRWNNKGTKMLYASSSLSLACLEVLVHIREPRFPLNYAWAEIDVPDSLIESLNSSTLDLSSRDACSNFGSLWLQNGRMPALKVPSVIIPTETNLLLNPSHPRFSAVQFLPSQPFNFDPRLFKVGPI